MILTVTIVSWNTKDLLRDCLRSLLSEDVRKIAEVHVVDNDSHDGSVQMVREEFPQVRVFANRENLGFARANNQSWRETTTKYWMLLNSDTLVNPFAIEKLVAFMESHPKAGMATAKLLNLDGTPQPCAQAEPGSLLTLLEYTRIHKLLSAKTRGRMLLGPYFSYDYPEQVGWAWGTALIARREAVEQVGALSEEFFMYGEDLEWSLRVRQGGWEIWFCPEAEIVHLGGQSTVQKWNDNKKQTIIWENCSKALESTQSKMRIKATHLTAAALSYVEHLLRKFRNRREEAENYKAYAAFNWRRVFDGTNSEHK